MSAQPPDELVVEPAQAEAEQRREQNAVDDLHPLGAVDGIEAALDGDGRPREAGDERVGLGGGDAEPPGRRAPDDNGDHRRHERRQGLMGVAAEVHHGENGMGHRRGDQRHEQKPQEIEHRRHDDGVPRLHGPSRDRRGDGIGRIRRAVHNDNADIKQSHHQKDGVLHKLGEEKGPLDRHGVPSNR